jgi:hypothetical protein
VKKQTIGSALFLMFVMILVGYVMYLQCRLDPIDQPDEPKIISETFKIMPEDFVIADGGGAEFYQGNLTLWKSAEISGKATYAFPDTFQSGILTLNLQVRRDVPEANGGLNVKTLGWSWQMGFGQQEDNVLFTVVSDTLDLQKTGLLLIEYSGDAKCNLDVIGGKLQLFKRATP